VSAALGSLPPSFWLLGLVPVVLLVLLWKLLVSAALVALAGWALIGHGSHNMAVLIAFLALASAAALLMPPRRTARLRPSRLHRQEVTP